MRKFLFGFYIFSLIVILGLLAVRFYGVENCHNLLRQCFSKPKTVESQIEHSKARVYPYPPRIPVIPKEGDTLTIVAFKDSQILHVYRSDDDERAVYKFVKLYPFKGFSGKLGPKLKEGDLQIPEGIYGVDFLNPNSRYHLSFRVAYPNDFEKQKAVEDGRDLRSLGGDIMIHGGSLTVGCIPIGNVEIETLFAWVGIVKKENVKVIIAPTNLLHPDADKILAGIQAPLWYPELCANIKSELEIMRERGASF